MHAIQKILRKKTRLCVGLMSGTSMDGIDAALVRIAGAGPDTRLSLIDWQTYPYPRGLKENLLALIDSGSADLSTLSQLHFLIGELFSDAVVKLLKKNSVDRKDVDLIGSHGQTVWHNPHPRKLFGKHITSTLQLGEPSVIQAKTGIVTVADFRVKDVALGGEGAPLMPSFDYLMFRSEREHCGALNIGGISNITVIPKNAPRSGVYGFDTGPGNVLIDRMMRTFFGKACDTQGRTARRSPPDRKLLTKLMRHSFVSKTPPKSTGREEFGSRYVNKICAWADELALDSVQIVSTVTEFTVLSVVKNYELYIKPRHRLDRIVASGGGVHNRELMERLRVCLPDVRIELSDEYGIPADCKEAVAFAVFANEAVSGNAVNIPAVTGARSPGILGKIIT